MKAPINKRVTDLHRLSVKIAMFLVTDTFTNESDVHQMLGEAIVLLDKSEKIMAANDTKYAAEQAAKT